MGWCKVGLHDYYNHINHPNGYHVRMGRFPSRAQSGHAIVRKNKTWREELWAGIRATDQRANEWRAFALPIDFVHAAENCLAIAENYLRNG